MGVQKFEALCRSGCCPKAALDAEPAARWAAVLVERGGGKPARAPARLRLTREETVELARLLDRDGFVAAARRAPGA
jgi:hypothetical protein